MSHIDHINITAKQDGFQFRIVCNPVPDNVRSKIRARDQDTQRKVALVAEGLTRMECFTSGPIVKADSGVITIICDVSNLGDFKTYDWQCIDDLLDTHLFSKDE